MLDVNHLAAGPPGAVAEFCRAWVRHAPRRETPCCLTSLSEDERWPAKLLDLSTGGVGLWLERPVDLGRFVLVELVSASGVFSRLLLTRVAHLSPHPEGGYVLGGEFIGELPEAEVRFLVA
ncbi:MAG TPA: PilZ domain-containing protein [Gemmataceae bacterium]|nr:PilZ domain-containing protein [Gemmataceae bacterium]